jgi:3-phytase
VKQVELFDAGHDRVGGRIVRRWSLGKCEGAVADDGAGVVYIAEERRGIWRVGAAPGDPTPGELVIRQESLAGAGDLEGLALAQFEADQRALIVSNQTANRFEVFSARGGHAWLGSFSLVGVEHSDGLEVLPVPLGKDFPSGLFGCHADAAEKCPVWLTSWSEIVRTLRPAESQ